MAFSNDKFSAVWVSHSSMGDFLKCPRLYYLHNVYKNPKTRRKVGIVAPAMSLGQAVHGVLEPLANIKAEERTSVDFNKRFLEEWAKVSGKIGGFTSPEEEKSFFERGRAMIERVKNHPQPLLKKAFKNKGDLPHFYLSQDDNLILCGKVDWLQYVEETDQVHILDFKTGKYDEKEDSLQLPIYHLIVDAIQKRKVEGASYWYIDRDDTPVTVDLPDLVSARERVMKVAVQVKNARDSKEFVCPQGEKGCRHCLPYELIMQSKAEYIGVGGYNQDLYLVPKIEYN